MKPYQVTFSLYAENDYEVKRLQDTLYNFVDTLYGEGIYVTADKMSDLLTKAYVQPFVKNLLR